MNKTYNFMAGLPRSGSTVLSALLNQHPDLYASPQTDLLELMFTMQTKIPRLQGFRAELLPASYEAVVSEMPNVFYSPISKPVVIDHNRGWGLPYNWDNLSGLLNQQGKVILTIRPILEVLASFLKIAEATEAKAGQPAYLNPELLVSHYRSKQDAQVDYLMTPNGEIDRAIFSIANLLKHHRDKVLIVWFDDLLDKPYDTMHSIYRFLGLPSFGNDFDNIIPADKHNDLAGYEMPDLHKVARKLARPDTDVSRYLSDYAITKYGNALEFLEL